MSSIASSSLLDMVMNEGGCSTDVAERIVRRVTSCYPTVSVNTFRKICAAVRSDNGDLVRLLTSRKNADVQRGYLIATRN